MERQNGPKGFIVMLPGEIIEIPQDSDESWLTLFYSLPRELAEKWKPACELSRCPYEVRKWHHDRSGKSISLEEMMKSEDGDIFKVADPQGEFE